MAAGAFSAPGRTMVRRWERFRDPWDREYAKRGRLWRGSAKVDPLPSFAPPPRQVLEVGCGDGKFLAGLAAAGYAPFGLDRSRHALKLVPAGPLRIRGDARRLPVRDRSFPIVVARYVLSALREAGRREASQELRRAVRADGLILVEDFSTEDFRFGSGRKVEERTFERNQGIETHYFEEGELESLMAGAGVVHREIVRSKLRVGAEFLPRVAWRFMFRP